MNAQSLKEDFIRLAAAVEALNGVYAGYMILSVSGMVVTGTFLSYLLLQSGVVMDFNSLNILWLATVQIICSCVMFMQGAKLNAEVQYRYDFFW